LLGSVYCDALLSCEIASEPALCGTVLHVNFQYSSVIGQKLRSPKRDEAAFFARDDLESFDLSLALLVSGALPTTSV